MVQGGWVQGGWVQGGCQHVLIMGQLFVYTYRVT